MHLTPSLPISLIEEKDHAFWLTRRLWFQLGIMRDFIDGYKLHIVSIYRMHDILYFTN